MSNQTKGFPFRYHEELEKDLEELRNRGLWSKDSKNSTVIKAVENAAEINRALKPFSNPTKYGYDQTANINDLVKVLGRIASSKRKSKKKGDILDINNLDLKTDIKIKGPKK